MSASFKHWIIPAIAFLGAAYCLAEAAGEKLLCVSVGCEVYASYDLLGLPIPLWGFGGFLLLAAMGTPPARPWNPWPFPQLVASALVIDSFFLAYQTLFWPCASCLFIAFLLGLIGLISYAIYPGCRRRRYLAASVLWLVFFVSVSIAFAKEALLTPWALSGEETSPIRVYFSPTCPACENLVLELLDSADFEKTAFIPVAKNKEDLQRIQRVAADEKKGREALRDLFLTEPLRQESVDRGVTFRLWVNKIHLADLGVTTLPVMISPTVPRSKDFLPTFSLPGFPFIQPESDMDSCSMATEETCPDTN